MGIEARAVDGDLVLRGRGRVLPTELRFAVREHKPDILDLLTAGVAPTLVCPACGSTDYLPLGHRWRRCWRCGQRWGPAGSADPGDPPDLARIGHLIGVRVAGR